MLPNFKIVVEHIIWFQNNVLKILPTYCIQLKIYIYFTLFENLFFLLGSLKYTMNAHLHFIFISQISNYYLFLNKLLKKILDYIFVIFLNMTFYGILTYLPGVLKTITHYVKTYLTSSIYLTLPEDHKKY